MIHDIKFDSTAPGLNAERISELMDAYLIDRRRRTQAKTVSGYRFKLRPFVTWWQALGQKRNWILSADDLPEYEVYLVGLGWSYNSCNDSLRRLKQMFRWAHQRGHIPIDFSMYVPKARGSAPVRHPVELASLAALLDACWKMSNPVRNRAIIAVLAGTGVRREECASLRIESITIMADGAGYIDPTTTKNDKPRLVAFDAPTGEFIHRWLDVLGKTEGPLFPSRKGGNALSPDGVYKVVMDAALLAGVDTDTHDLRRMFATMWSKKLRGESYGQLLQKQLGHANYETTTVYSLQDITDVLDVLRKANVSPLAQLATKTP